MEASLCRLRALGFGVVVVGFEHQLFGHQDDPVGVLVVDHAQAADGPRGFYRFDELRCGRGYLARFWQVSQHAFEVVRECGDLLLFETERHDLAQLQGLEEENSLALGADAKESGEVKSKERLMTAPASSGHLRSS